MDTDSFIVYVKTDINSDIAEAVATGYDASNYGLNNSLQKGKNKDVIGTMKDE